MNFCANTAVFAQSNPAVDVANPASVRSSDGCEMSEGQSNIGLNSTQRVIDFESYGDRDLIDHQYGNLGLTIQGAVVLQQGGALNTPHYLPKSGINVIYDGFRDDFGIRFVFDSSKAVLEFGFFFTAMFDLNVKIYDRNNSLLSDRNLVGKNYAPLGKPNHEFSYRSNLVPIGRVEVHTINSNQYYYGWNSFTLDDVYFDSNVLCELAVTKLYQTDPKWAGELYGSVGWKGSDGFAPTIKNWGCALVSATMLLNQQAEKIGIRTTDPHELNQWLRSADGGYAGGQINFFRVADFAKQVLGMNVEFVGRNYNINDKKIMAELCALNSVVMEVRGTRGHFVLARGFDEKGYLMNDPLGPADHLLEKYPSGPVSLRQFALSDEFNGIELVVSSDVVIKVSDPNGNVLQIGSLSGQERSVSQEPYSEILGATAYHEYLAPYGGEEKDVLVGTRVIIPVLASGNYSIQIVSPIEREAELSLIVATRSHSTVKQVRQVFDEGTTYVMNVNYLKPTKDPADFGDVSISDLQDGWKLYFPVVVAQ
ncbi:MAG: hypothetical protein E6Q58_04260 [Niabella sp.]|nr:MAG: hypothetical protein E6Q58_04260 [Niabella sp.]